MAEQSNDGSRPASGRRILVIDDDATILELIREVLVEEGHQVDTALNGPDALLLDGTHAPPDVCVLDMFMPGLSGPDLVAQLRAKFGPRLPVLLTSASIVDKEARELGAYAYLPKPFDLEDLVDAVSWGLVQE